MSELWKLIQQHLDEYGVRDAALARRMGTAPQTLNSWKKRGMKQLPDKELLESLAREIRQPYERVLGAVLMDLEYASSAQLEELGSVGLQASRLPDSSVSVRAVDRHGNEAGPVQAAFVESFIHETPELMAAALIEMTLREGTAPSAFKGIDPDDSEAIFQRVVEVFREDSDLRERTLSLIDTMVPIAKEQADARSAAPTSRAEVSSAKKRARARTLPKAAAPGKRSRDDKGQGQQ